MNFKHLLLVSLSILLFSACEKKETPITLPPKGDGAVMQVDMGETYEYQYFINLQTQQIVHISPISNWDLALQCGENDSAIFLNGGNGMSAFNTNKTDFATVGYGDTTNSSKKWRYDGSGGEADSTAIDSRNQKRNVYLIRLDNTYTKIRKFQISYEDAFEYIILVGDINSTQAAPITIYKNKDKNFVYFSFDFLATVPDVEPDKNTWDLEVTRYNYTFFDQEPDLHYVVNGILLNPSNTYGYKDSVHTYTEMTPTLVTQIALTNKKDIIGYDWKKYDIDKNIYTIDSRYNYFIQNQNGSIFKMRFLDYYSTSGIKGSPKFEFNQIK